MLINTKNFHPDTDPKLLCTCGHADCDERSVSQEHLNRVQKVREIVGYKIQMAQLLGRKHSI